MQYFITDIEPLTKIGTHKPHHATLLAEITNLAFPVRLYRTAGSATQKGCFAVQYGQQVDCEMTRKEASESFGQSVFHVVQCMGLID